MALENSSDENQWRAIPLVLSAFTLAAAVIAIGQYVGVEKGSGPQAELSPQVLPSPQKLAIPRLRPHAVFKPATHPGMLSARALRAASRWMRAR